VIDNLKCERTTFVSHLECSLSGERHEPERLWNLSRAGMPLLVRYNLPAIKKAITKSDLLERTPDLWRYREFLPVKKMGNIVSLGETITPVLSAPRCARAIGAHELLIKDEGRLPTGSFKARGLAVAVSMAKEFGVQRVAMPSAGNAGAALAAYCARAGIEAYIFYPDDAPSITVSEISLYGGRGFAVNGLISDLGPLVENGRDAAGWFSVATLKEPYRVEGKKTMGLELAEQFDWDLPEVIVYPTGGGTGLIGMWKAFAELEAVGWIGKKRPRMVAVQARTCAPIVRAFEQGKDRAEPWENGFTAIPGVRVPSTIGDFLILKVLRESCGFAVAIDDEDAEEARRSLARSDGVHLSPEGAATLAGCRKAIADGRIRKDERVLLFNCATGLKYPINFAPTILDRHKPINFSALVAN
jgi:threonine synthase